MKTRALATAWLSGSSTLPISGESPMAMVAGTEVASAIPRTVRAWCARIMRLLSRAWARGCGSDAGASTRVAPASIAKPRILQQPVGGQPAPRAPPLSLGWASDNLGGMITFEQASVRYGERLALDSLSWHMNEGECVVFLGPSGAGKTTILRLITHEAQPTSGSVTVGTFVGGRLPRAHRALLRR